MNNNKYLKSRILWATLLLIFTQNSFSAGETIEIKNVWNGQKYYIDGKQISEWKLRGILNKNVASKNEMSGYWPNTIIMATTWIAGAGYIGQSLGGSAAGSDSQNNKLLPGLALIGIGSYFSIRNNKLLREAINKYNSRFSSKNDNISYMISPTFSRITYKFY